MAGEVQESSLSQTAIIRFLCESDSKLAKVIATVGDLKIRGKRDGFEALVRAIVGQQLSVKAAQTIFARVVATCEGGSLSAGNYLKADKTALRQAGLSARKESFLHGLAAAVADGFLCFTALENDEDENVIQRLCAIKGIGRWTAEMHLMFGMNRPDVFPMDDLALQRVMCRVYGWHPTDFPTKGPRVAKKWQPFRSLACRYLYNFGDMADSQRANTSASRIK